MVLAQKQTRCVEQNLRPEINPHSYSHFQQGTQKHVGRNTASSTNGAGENGT
jgi:hypothetical protein